MINLEEIRKERLSYFKWKNIIPLRKELESLPEILDTSLEINDTIKIEKEISPEEKNKIKSLALNLRSWRKGPFEIFGIYIDSEWKSYIKFNILKPHINLKDKIVADIGCNNGYYLFRMLEFMPKKLVGFDPSVLFKTQFDFINHFAKTSIIYELLGIEHLEFYEHKFDVIFCLGILYHRNDVIGSLKILKKSLNANGEVFLDTLIIKDENPICLCPQDSYAKMSNVYFLPSLKALEVWIKKAGFKEIEILKLKKTDTNEQRKTPWVLGQSLENFLDENDQNLTVEGYPAPIRAYLKLKC